VISRTAITRCSEHFTLAEMTITGVNASNIPDEWHARNLVVLCEMVLEPWRDHVGPLRVTSGFRSPDVNLAVGGARGSQHLRGEAADVKPLTFSISEAWHDLISGSARAIPVDQAVCYIRSRGAGWIHVSCSPGRQPRRQFLVQPHGRPGVYLPAETWTDPLVL